MTAPTSRRARRSSTPSRMALVRLDAPYQATIERNTQALDLARAVAGIELPIALDGTADVRLEAEGPLEQWRDGRASLEVTALDGRVQTLPVALREPARARYDDGRVVVERLEGSVGKTGLCRRCPSVDARCWH